MAERGLEQRVENLEHRVETVEQILPTLATKADLAAAIAPLATKAELQAAIAPLATKVEVKAEIKAEGEATRRHFDVVAEGLRSDVALLATAVSTLSTTLDRSLAENSLQHATFIAALDVHDVRLTALERPPEATP